MLREWDTVKPSGMTFETAAFGEDIQLVNGFLTFSACHRFPFCVVVRSTVHTLSIPYCCHIVKGKKLRLILYPSNSAARAAQPRSSCHHAI